MIEQGGWRPGSGWSANAAPGTISVVVTTAAATRTFFTVTPVKEIFPRVRNAPARPRPGQACEAYTGSNPIPKASSQEVLISGTFDRRTA